MVYVYPAVFTEDEQGGYSVAFRDFDHMTCGENMQDAAERATELLWVLVDEFLQQDESLPKPLYDEPEEGFLVVISVEVNTERGLLDTKAAACMLDVSTARIRQMLASGQLVGKKRGRDNYVYLWSVKRRLESSPKVGRPRVEKVVQEQTAPNVVKL